MIDLALSKKPFAVVAHRGGVERYPENTIAAIKYALRIKCDIIEVDIRRTKDGELILLHDEDFMRVSGVNLKALEADYEYIKEHILIENSEPVATLRQVLETVAGKGNLFLEIKEPETTEDVLRLVDEFGAWDWVAIVSFWEEAIKIAKRLYPDVRCGLVYSTPPGKIVEAKELGAQIVLPHFRLATMKANRFAHSLGLKVVAWTINDDDLALEMYERGVDAIATDYPKQMLALRKRLEEGGVIKRKNVKFELFETKDGVLLRRIVVDKDHIFLEQNPHKLSKYGVAYKMLKERYPSFYMFWELKDDEYTGRLLTANIVKKREIDEFIDKILQNEDYKKYKDFKDGVGGD